MAKRSVGKPRFYAPLDQYLKAKGYYRGARTGNMTEFVQGEEVWNMNPTQPFQYTLTTSDNSGHYFEFYINTEPPETDDYSGLLPAANKELEMLLSKAPESSDESKSGFYAACLGHKFADRNLSFYAQYSGADGQGDFDGASSGDYTSFINCGDFLTPVEYNGYSIQHFKNFGASAYSEMAYTMFRITASNPSGVLNEGETESMGALSWGRWFEPEHSVDLDVTLMTSYEGIEEQTTIGGSSLSNINYLGNPNWGDLPAWTLEKQEGNDYNIGSQSPRRTWRIKLSYLSDTNIFNTATNENKFFTWTDPEELEGVPEYQFDASMASFMGLTFNGSLPFLFNPDSSADNKEFAICKIDQDSISYKQVAFRTWDVSFVIREVW